MEQVVEAPPNGGLLRVMLVRKPSLKFDNLVRGTAWIDQVSLTPLRRKCRAELQLCQPRM